MIGIIDYGLGNITAFANIYKQINTEIIIVKNVNDLTKINKIILPGVGSFDWAIESLNRSGFRDALEKCVIFEKKPILGVCVGMQIMAESSEEGKEKGLSWIRGSIKKFTNNNSSEYYPLPHMGWNQVNFKQSSIAKGIDNSSFYFLHSYYFESDDEKNILATSIYSKKFTSAISKNNIYGVQFHPEKSHKPGQKLLINFYKRALGL